MSSEKQYMIGDTAVCRSCGKKIFYVGPYWQHEGKAQPRHIGQPLEAVPVARPGHVSIAMERERQIVEEGWTAKHDGQWANDELVRAAVYYALPRRYDVLIAWPWAEEWNKKGQHSRIRQLEIAGALIAAEIDRLQRLEEG